MLIVLNSMALKDGEISMKLIDHVRVCHHQALQMYDKMINLVFLNRALSPTRICVVRVCSRGWSGEPPAL